MAEVRHPVRQDASKILIEVTTEVTFTDKGKSESTTKLSVSQVVVSLLTTVSPSIGSYSALFPIPTVLGPPALAGFRGSVIGATDSLTTVWMTCDGLYGFHLTWGPSTYDAITTRTKKGNAPTDPASTVVYSENWSTTSTTEEAQVTSIAYRHIGATGNTETIHSDTTTFHELGSYKYIYVTVAGGLAKLTPSTTLSPNATTSSNTSPATSIDTSTSPQGTLSTGAKAGIGVGVSVLVLLNIGFVTWFLLWRRRHRQPATQPSSPPTELKPQLEGTEVFPEKIHPGELGVTPTQELSEAQVHEAEAEAVRSSAPQELEGSEVKRSRFVEAHGKEDSELARGELSTEE